MKRFPSMPPPPTHVTRVRLATRAVLLVACLALGAVVGVVGRHLTGSDAWFLALPLCVVVGWFVVADPTACDSARPSCRDDKPAR